MIAIRRAHKILVENFVENSISGGPRRSSTVQRHARDPISAWDAPVMNPLTMCLLFLPSHLSIREVVYTFYTTASLDRIHFEL
jgi:hypothetical protein